MKIRLAINGFGRIGRCIIRTLFENNRTNEFELVAINDINEDLSILSHILQYDSVHGFFNHKVTNEDRELIIDSQRIKTFDIKNPELLPWKDLDIDLVLECSGVFTTREKSNKHLIAGAKKVLISAPGDKNVDATIVYGVNHQIITPQMKILSNASCTTNCLAPIVKVLHNEFTIECGLMTTIHSYTSDQVLLDNYHPDYHRSRSAALSIIPTKSGASKAVGLVIPQLNGKIDGVSVRVPVPNVSLVDFSFNSYKQPTASDINQVITEASNDYLSGILAVSNIPLVSCDFNHNKHSSIFDLTQTIVQNKMSKVFSWYDNEWGFSNRMLDTALYMFNC